MYRFNVRLHFRTHVMPFFMRIISVPVKPASDIFIYLFFFKRADEHSYSIIEAIELCDSAATMRTTCMRTIVAG